MDNDLLCPCPTQASVQAVSCRVSPMYLLLERPRRDGQLVHATDTGQGTAICPRRPRCGSSFVHRPKLHGLLLYKSCRPPYNQLLVEQSVILLHPEGAALRRQRCPMGPTCAERLVILLHPEGAALRRQRCPTGPTHAGTLLNYGGQRTQDESTITAHSNSLI